MIDIWKRAIARIYKPFFARKFDSFDLSSNIGRNNVGSGCLIQGHKHIAIGANSYIGEGSEIICLEKHFTQRLEGRLIVGDHVRITKRCRITAAGTIRIADHVLIAPDVFITDNNHGMDPTGQEGYSPQPLTVKNVSIEEGVWLGQRVCVLPGVTIGAHSIIGANSVVTHDIPPYSIAAGIPAKVKKSWNSENNEWVKI